MRRGCLEDAGLFSAVMVFRGPSVPFAEHLYPGHAVHNQCSCVVINRSDGFSAGFHAGVPALYGARCVSEVIAITSCFRCCFAWLAMNDRQYDLALQGWTRSHAAV